MKITWTPVLGALAALASAQAHAAPIPASAAGAHVGHTATVEGLVSEVHTAHSGAETFIDVGGKYPNQAFTAVIFAPHMAAVGDLSALAGKTIDLTGLIEMYEGKPGMTVDSRTQIKVR